VIGIRTNTSTAHLYAIEKGAGIGVLPNFAAALGAPVVPLDVGGQYSLDIWLTYHRDVRASPHIALLIDWIRGIFSAKTYPWFGDDFIHPNALLKLLPDQARVNSGAGFLAVDPDKKQLLLRKP
jgi:hypothetical protein